MKSVAFAAILLAASVSISKAEPMTVGDCLGVLSGLDLLDHYDDAATGRPRQYKLGKARITIALNMTSLRHIRDAVEVSRLGLIRELSGGGEIKPNSVEFNKFQEEMKGVLSKPCDVTPGRINLSELKIGDGADDNAIAPSILSALAPILDRE